MDRLALNIGHAVIGFALLFALFCAWTYVGAPLLSKFWDWWCIDRPRRCPLCGRWARLDYYFRGRTACQPCAHEFRAVRAQLETATKIAWSTVPGTCDSCGESGRVGKDYREAQLCVRCHEAHLQGIRRAWLDGRRS